MRLNLYFFVGASQTLTERVLFIKIHNMNVYAPIEITLFLNSRLEMMDMFRGTFKCLQLYMPKPQAESSAGGTSNLIVRLYIRLFVSNSVSLSYKIFISLGSHKLL